MAFNIANALQPSTFDPVGISQLVQRNQLAQSQDARANAEFGMRQQEFNNSLAQQDQAKQQADAQQFAAEAKWVLSAPVGQRVQLIHQLPHVLDMLQKNGQDPNQLTEDQATSVAQHALAHASSILGQGPEEPKYQNVAPGGSLVQTNADGAPKTVFSAPKPETFGAPTDLVMGGRPSVAQIGSEGTVRPVAGATPYNKPPAASAVAGNALDPDTIHDAAIDVMADPTRIRQYATFGQSGQAIRTAINNEKTKILKSVGLTEPQLIRQQAIAKGQIKSTSDLVGMQNAVNAYETLAKGNGQRVIDLVNSVNTSGVPLINSAERIGKLASGNADAAELMLVLHNYQVEAARIVTQPSLKGQLTDQAINDIKTVTPANLTPAQAVRLVNRLNFEFDLRQRGIEGSLEQAASGITPGFPTVPAAQPPAAAAPAAPKKTINFADLPK